MEVGHSCGSRPSDKGGGVVPVFQPLRLEGGPVPKNIFKGGGPPGSATGASQIGEVTCRIYVN